MRENLYLGELLTSPAKGWHKMSITWGKASQRAPEREQRAFWEEIAEYLDRVWPNEKTAPEEMTGAGERVQ